MLPISLSLGFWLTAAILPLAVVGLLLVRPGHPWSTRHEPAALFRLALGPVFAGIIFPPFGILALQGSIRWYLYGWETHSGNYLWPAAAMTLVVGLHSPLAVLRGALCVMLAVGVLQVILALAQRLGWPLLKTPQGVIGTIGHRTGVGIYLGLLIPLAFLAGPTAGWTLTAIYALGLWLARSVVSWACALTGLLWVHPEVWPAVLPLLMLAMLHRFVKWNGGAPKQRICGDTIVARLVVWTTALRAFQLHKGTWVIGHGADSFYQDSLKWVTAKQMHEVYREAHNDYIERFYEYGLVGLAAFAWWAYLLWPALRWGDPYTGSTMGFLVAALGNFPSRVAPLVGVMALVFVTLAKRVLG